MPAPTDINAKRALDYSIIWEALRAHPESYVNFGEYWWTLKRMLADWAEEDGDVADADLIRSHKQPPHAVEVEESEVYQFLDEFSGVEDFQDWIAYVNPRLIWDETLGEEISIEDSEWEENFL